MAAAGDRSQACSARRTKATQAGRGAVAAEGRTRHGRRPVGEISGALDTRRRPAAGAQKGSFPVLPEEHGRVTRAASSAAERPTHASSWHLECRNWSVTWSSMHADGETFTMAMLLMTRRSLSTQHQALPVHVRARVGSQGDLGLEVAGQVGGVAAPVSDSASAVEPRQTIVHKRLRILAFNGLGQSAASG